MLVGRDCQRHGCFDTHHDSRFDRRWCDVMRLAGCENWELLHVCAGGAIGCVTTGPFANWLSPDWPETSLSGAAATQTTKCFSRGVNWDIGTSGGASGALSHKLSRSDLSACVYAPQG